MAEAIGAHSGAVSISSALTRSRSGAATSLTSSLTNPRISVKSLSSGGSSETRGNASALRSVTNRNSDVNPAGRGAGSQVTAGLPTPLKWITGLLSIVLLPLKWITGLLSIVLHPVKSITGLLSIVLRPAVWATSLLRRAVLTFVPRSLTAGAESLAVQVNAALPAPLKWITGLLSDVLHPDNNKSTNTVTYKGTAVIAKKRAAANNLIQLDLIDANADIEDKNAELLENKKIQIQLVSEDLDPKTNGVKLSANAEVKNWLLQAGDLDFVADEDSFPIDFSVPTDFGLPGAFIIKNNHPNEFYIRSLVLQGSNKTTVEFSTNAWVYNTKKYPKDRVFFSNKVFLPSVTPPGLKALREQELQQYRGDGTGERQPADRIYDYDVYNDLGNPDKSSDLARPPLGGSKDSPYPRRMRTGRPKTKADPKSESPVGGLITSLPYIPSDEYFLRTKNSTFVATLIKGALQEILPILSDAFSPGNSFKSFDDVKDIYNNDSTSVPVPKNVSKPEPDAAPGSLVYLNTIFDSQGENTKVLRYALPQVIAEVEDAWTTDEEFGRQALAGINPNVIQVLKSYPPKSALDPAEYGQGTALTDQDILPYLEDLTVAQAIEQKKLFTIDYHDAILPILNRSNADTKRNYLAYATRTIFYLNKAGKLKPVAIELSLPPANKGGASTNKVLTPADTDDHLWGLAKCHASTTDFNYHEVLTHFTFTHGAMEPFIIASNRQLSQLHPIRSLLEPYFKDTLAINAAARAVLINSNAIIEQNFSLGKYSFQAGTAGYGAFWQFDTQALPQNLIARGMAEPADASYPGSVKLLVEDYPYAKDGLEIWDAINQYVSKYVELTYQGSDDAVKEDTELQAWWNEIVTVGHGDFKDADWWPKLDSTKNLVQIITTIAWIGGPLHAAVNFGQYAYSGYPLNKNAATRKFIPEKGSADYNNLQSNPEKFILDTIGTSSGTLQVLTTLELLVTHSVDEEYIGHRNDTLWTSDPKVIEVFSEFSANVTAIGDNIIKRNKDKSLINRLGPAEIPYTLLYPTSGSGLTGQGVPNSVSI